jgi:hypothetical protein
MADQVFSGDTITFVRQGGVPVTVVRRGGIFVRVASSGGKPVRYVPHGGALITVERESELPEDVKEQIGY